MESAELWIRMSMVHRLNAQQTSAVIERLMICGDVHIDALLASGLNHQQSREFIHADPHHISSALTWLNHPCHHIVVYSDPDYPPLLRQIASAPVLLFIAGDYRILHSPQIALVGSRQFTHYGERWGHYFAAELVRCGLTITSGLAVGIDSLCHQAALDAEGKTIAVLGSGLENIYPRQHRELANKIQDIGGALVSEFLTTALPIAAHFPRRNRIISGLSLGVVVVQATLKSGSLITARYALDQGRDVFALPGPLGSQVSEGVHWLIQQGAYLAVSPRDIIEQISNTFQWIVLEGQKQGNALQEKKEGILPCIDILTHVGDEVTSVDLIAKRAARPVSEVVTKLVELELAGCVAAVPGGYVRINY